MKKILMFVSVLALMISVASAQDYTAVNKAIDAGTLAQASTMFTFANVLTNRAGFNVKSSIDAYLSLAVNSEKGAYIKMFRPLGAVVSNGVALTNYNPNMVNPTNYTGAFKVYKYADPYSIITGGAVRSNQGVAKYRVAPTTTVPANELPYTFVLKANKNYLFLIENSYQTLTNTSAQQVGVVFNIWKRRYP